VLRGVTARFGDLTAIRDLSRRVPRGRPVDADRGPHAVFDTPQAGRVAFHVGVLVVFDAVAWIAAVLLVRDALVD